MDDIKRPNIKRASTPLPVRRQITPSPTRAAAPVALVSPNASSRQVNQMSAPVSQDLRTVSISLDFNPLVLAQVMARKAKKVIARFALWVRPYLPKNRKYPVIARIGWGFMALVMASTIIFEILSYRQTDDRYKISAQAEALVDATKLQLAQSLRFEPKEGVYYYNQGYTPGGEIGGLVGGPKFTANFNSSPEKGSTVTDPVTQTSVTFKPDFGLAEPRQDQNRLIYPLKAGTAQKIYTLKATGLKEDIVLNEFEKDTMDFRYKLELSDGTEARMESDGSVGVYGAPKELLGNVSTATENDASLLKKARQNAEKSTLLFTFPAPFVKEVGRKSSGARAWYSLKGDELTLHASGLKQASYPLSIDPSVYIETARKLMRGNNETNTDFDTTYDLIQKSQTTGARIDYWSNSTEMSGGVWDQAMAAAGGYVYRAGGRADPTMPYIVSQQSTVQSSNSTTFTLAMPSTRPAGDLYVAVIGRVGTGAITAPASWSANCTSIREHMLCWKIGTDQGGGNEAASYNWTIGSGVEWAGVVLRIKNFNSGSPISTAATTSSSASASIPSYPAITPAHDASLIIRSVAINADNPTSATWLPYGHTRIYSGASSTDTTSVGLAVSYLDTPPLASNAASAASFVNDGILSDTWGATSIAIRPATVTAGVQSTVEWAQFNQTSSAIDSPNPGAGTCSGWCNDSAYNLPAARMGMSMFAYNGFLYAMGGSTDGTPTNGQSTVWIAKLGANGEPQLWHPSGGAPVYWYVSSNTLPAARSYAGIVAANNKMYLVGGRDTSGNSLSTVHVADVLPTGDIGAWSTTGMQTMPNARHGHSVQIYNSVMYLFGGLTTSSGGSSNTFRDTVYYSKLTSTGAMNSWVQTNSFTTDSGAVTSPRASFGGQMVAIQGGYVYMAGGCTAVTVSGSNLYCNTIATDVQLASINADGSLAPFNRILNLSNQRIGYTLMAWQGGLYRFGGCNRQNTSTGTCQAVHQSTEFGVVNPSGDASTVRNSTKAGSGTCQGSSPTNCNLPDPGDAARAGGQLSSMTVINNGYVYVIGGCSTSANPGTCSDMSGNISYSAINSTGTLVRPAQCGGQYGTNIREAGVITQSGTAVTGTGTDFDSSIVSRTIIYEDNTTATVSSVSSTTAMVSSVSKTISTVQKYAFGITQSGTTVSGGDGRWTSSIVGSTLVYADGTSTTVTGFTSATQITVTTSRTISTAQRYGFETNWCVDSTNQVNGTSGVGAAATAVFNNTIYVIGGTNGSGTWTANIRRALLNADGSLAGAWITQAPGAAAGQTGLPTGSFPGVASGSGIGYSYAFTRSNPSAASSTPGNLFIVGGCNGSGGIGCTTTNYSTGVYKCNISSAGDIATNSCTTTGQLQIDPDGAGLNGEGLGLMSGSVYANRVYLVGGACEVATGGSTTDPCGSTYNANRKDTIYAAIDSSNNIVDANTSDSNTWTLTTAQMSPVRRRGSAFGYNGYIYSLAGYSGSASLQDLLFAKVDVSTGDVVGVGGGTSFDSSAVVVTPRWDLRAAVSNGYVYALGGCGGTTAVAPTCSTYTESTVQTFQLYNNDAGTPVSYAASANQFANDRLGAGSAILNGYIYIAGGCLSGGTDCATPTNSVQYAAIDANGDIGTWSAGGNLPVARAWGRLVAAGGTLYYLGGQTGSAVTTAVGSIYYTSGISSGNPTWAGSTATKGIGDTGSGAQNRTQFGAYVWDNRIYVTGGYTGASTTAVSNAVYVSPNLTSGGDITANWTSSSNTFNVARSGHTTIAYANNIYVLGGYDGTNYLSDVQMASIGYKVGTITQSGTTITGAGSPNWTSAMVGMTLQYNDGTLATIQTVPSTSSMTVNVTKTISSGEPYVVQDGSVGTWSFTTSLPEPIRQGDGFAANGYMYLIGGRSSDGDCTPNNLVAPISANTVVNNATTTSGINNPTGIGEWYETNVKYTGERYGNAVSYANGRLYVLGGACENWPAPLTVGPTVASQTFGTDATSHVVTMPATVDPGDLLMVFFTNDGNATVTTPAGWSVPTNGTQVETTNVRGSVFVKDAAGTEDGTTVDFVTSAVEQAAAQVYRIPAAMWEGNITSVEVANVAGSSTNAPNPPNLDPAGWGTENTTWFSYAAGSSYTSVTTYPTNHTNGLHTISNTGTAGASASSSFRQNRAASEDPAAYAMSTTSSGTAFTIAVRPAAITYTGSNRTVQTAVYSQPQVAAYSRMIDTDTDVFPTKWLMNGLDSSIGARWQLRYRSMHDLDAAVNPNEDCGTSSTMAQMTTWGQETVFGDVTLGSPGAYIPKESGGGNINCARYYYFYVNIDASQTFGYPEDVNRGPTISDLSLFYTADPSKRLIHGKTFTGGEQQPLDTPF